MILLFLSIIVLLFVYLIGISILSIFNINSKYMVLFAPAIASYIIGILSFLIFLININTKLLLYINFIMIIVLLIYFYKHILNLFSSKYFLLFLMFYLSMLFLQTSMNDFGGAFWYGDWYMHYDISLFYSGIGSADNVSHFGYTFISRTPLLNLICAYFMRLFGSNFYIFQIVSVFLNSLIFYGVVILVETYFDKKIIYIVLQLFVCNFLFLHHLSFLWPKLFPLYLFLVSFFIFKQKIVNCHNKSIKTKNIFIFSIAITGACFSHLIYASYSLALIFIIIILLILKKIKINYRKIFLFIFIFIFPFIIWLTWYIYKYGTEDLLTSTPQYVLAKDSGYSAKTILKAQFENTLDTFIPFRLFFFMYNEYQHNKMTNVYNNFLRIYTSTLPGGLGIIFYIILLFFIYKIFQDKNYFKNNLPYNKLYLTIITFFGTLSVILSHTNRNPGGLIQSGLSLLMIIVFIFTISYSKNYFKSTTFSLLKYGYIIENIIIYSSYLIITNYMILDGHITNHSFKVDNNLIFLSDIFPYFYLFFALFLFSIFLQILIYRNLEKFRELS